MLAPRVAEIPNVAVAADALLIEDASLICVVSDPAAATVDTTGDANWIDAVSEDVAEAADTIDPVSLMAVATAAVTDAELCNAPANE